MASATCAVSQSFNMAEIIPAILENSFKEIVEKLGSVAEVAPIVQLDICDGVFVEAVTWPYVSPVREGKPFNYERSFDNMLVDTFEMPHIDDVELELDLMVVNPKRCIRDLLVLGPRRVILHIESLKDPLNDLHDIARLIPGIVEIGIAVNPDTDIAKVEELLDERLVTCVQCMGLSKLGVQGTPFDETTFEKTCAQIRTLREKNPDLPISVDGGVSLTTAKRLIAAGATRLVCGSAVFSSESPVRAVAKLKAVI